MVDNKNVNGDMLVESKDVSSNINKSSLWADIYGMFVFFMFGMFLCLYNIDRFGVDEDNHQDSAPPRPAPPRSENMESHCESTSTSEPICDNESTSGSLNTERNTVESQSSSETASTGLFFILKRMLKMLRMNNHIILCLRNLGG